MMLHVQLYMYLASIRDLSGITSVMFVNSTLILPDLGHVDDTFPWKHAVVSVLFTNTAQISIERAVPWTVQKVRLHRK